MRKNINQKIKVILAIFLILFSIVMIRLLSNKKIARIKEQGSNESIIKIKYGSKIYEGNILKDEENKSLDSIDGIKNENQDNVQAKSGNYENNFINKIKDNLCNILNINKKIEIDTKDINAPDNINKIDVKVLEDNVIINFIEPKDNGTDYEYIVKNENTEEKLNFHSESGIYGYSYKISNDKETQADNSANKLDNSPIVIQNLDWDKDYFIHIKTIDKSNNISENNTIKIDLPSLGAKVEYIDKATQMSLSMSEKITGMIGDDYDATKKIKELQGYTLVNNVGETQGKLKREPSTIQFEYAKNAKLNVKYIDEESKNEIAVNTATDCYIGKELELKPKMIQGYVPNESMKNIKIENEENEIIFTYRKFENKIEVKDEAKEDEASKEETNINKSDGTINNTSNYKSKQIKIRYIDISTNKLLFEDKIVAGEEKQIKYKLKRIEGYKLVNSIDDNSNDKKESIMDEIINSLDVEANEIDDGLTDTERRKTMAKYEIVMNCDESDYIIYYKK